MSTILEEPADIAWLRDNHVSCLPQAALFVVLYGNEDAPEKVEAWFQSAPDFDQAPDFIWHAADFEADVDLAERGFGI